ncbi:MAG: tyrosine/phenylalanine carboxypeptidase domain-containing protein, partial [Flavobacteriaceae bacterium]
GGGFTKDRLYLSGLYQLLTYGNDLPLDWLLAGKTSLAYVDLIQEIGDDITILKPLKYQSLSFDQNLGLGTEVDHILKACI